MLRARRVYHRLRGRNVMDGVWTITAYEGEVRHDEHGNVVNRIVWRLRKHNLIVTTGKEMSLNRLFGLQPSGAPGGTAEVALSSVGVGTDSTAAAIAQTQLNPTVAGTVLIQTADAGTSRTALVATMTSTFGTAVANFDWKECGLFNGNVNGTSKLFNRIAPIGPFTKSVAVSIVLRIDISQA